MLIAGDIGGTKTLLAIYNRGERAGTPVLQMEYRTADYTALDAMVREFLAASGCVGAHSLDPGDDYPDFVVPLSPLVKWNVAL